MWIGQWVGPVEPTRPIDTVSTANAAVENARAAARSPPCAARTKLLMVSSRLLAAPGRLLFSAAAGVQLREIMSRNLRAGGLPDLLVLADVFQGLVERRD